MAIWGSPRIRQNRFGQDGGVAAAAERILAGGAVGLFRDAGYPSAPAWAYLNRMAHSSWSDLLALAANSEGGKPGGWTATLAFVAAGMLSFERCPANVERTQREVLIPLELDMLEGQVAEPSNPAEFASLLMDVLDRHRTWRTW